MIMKSVNPLNDGFPVVAVNGFEFIDAVKDGDGAVAREPGQGAFAVIEENPFGDIPGSGNSGFVLAAIQHKTFHGVPFVWCGH